MIIPFCVILYLGCKKSKLNDLDIRLKFGFLYNGYRLSFFYWYSNKTYIKIYKRYYRGFINIMRQTLLSYIFTSSSLDINSQIILAMILVFSFLIIQLKYEPYISSQMNTVEVFSLVAANSTLISGFIMLNDDNIWLQNLFSILIIVSNILFIIHFLKSIIWIYAVKHFNLIVRFFPCFLKLFVIFDRGKYFFLFFNFRNFFSSLRNQKNSSQKCQFQRKTWFIS